MCSQCVVNPAARLEVGPPVDDMADYRVLDYQWPFILIKRNLVNTAVISKTKHLYRCLYVSHQLKSCNKFRVCHLCLVIDIFLYTVISITLTYHKQFPSEAKLCILLS